MGEFVAFDRKDGRGGHLGSTEKPVVTVTVTGVYFGADVWRDVLDEAEYVEYLTDAEDLRVGFRAVDEDDVHASAYSISEYQARAAPVWDRLGMDVDGATHVPLDTDSEEFPVIDVSEFVDGDESDSSEDASTNEDDERAAAAESNGNGSDSGVQDLAKDDLYDALDAFDVPQSVSVGDFVQAIDGERGYYDAAERLDVDRQTIVELVHHLGIRDALENEEGALARGLALDQEASA